MQPQMIPAGTEVTALVASARKPSTILTYSGVVVAGRYPHMYLTLSVGGSVVRLPWERVESTK